MMLVREEAEPKEVPVLYVVKCNGIFSPDQSKGESALMFEHLFGSFPEHPVRSFRRIRLLASLHGWDVSRRRARKDELDDEE